MQFFRGLGVADVIVGMIGVGLAVFLFASDIPGRFWMMFGVLGLFFLLLMRIDNDKVYVMVLHMLKHFTSRHSFRKGAANKNADITAITPFTGISDGVIEYGGDYYAKVIEIQSIEFRFLTDMRQDAVIDRVFGAVLRQSGDLMVSLIKLDQPVNYDTAMDGEEEKLKHIRESHFNGLFTDDELACRVEVIRDRIEEM